MAEKNKGILEMLNRGVMSAASLPYNLASDFTNAIPFINTPYIDADADGFMQGGFVDKKDFDAVEGFGTEKLKKRIADKKAKDSGIAALTDEKFYEDKILRDLERKKEKENNSKKTTEKTDNKKETTAEKEKDDRGILQKLFEKYDLVSLGNSIGRGEGLLPAIEAQDAAIKQEAKDLAAAKITAAKTEADISYKMALAQQAIREKNPEFIRTLTAMGIDPTDPQALVLYKEKISKSSSIDPMMLMLLKNQGLIDDAQFDNAINSSMGGQVTPTVSAVDLMNPDQDLN
tara:strand:- start:1549 stop:2412 length:864 start_codon:yes stop_codon:yes gene_type:complete